MTGMSPGLIKADIMTARYALNEYEANGRFKDIKNICGYHIQQAVEKLIKYQIYQQVEEVDNRQMYTHNIGALLAYAKKRGLDLVVPEYILKNSEVITSWEAGSRYDLHFSVRVDTLRKMLSVVNIWYDEIFQKECDSTGKD